MEQEQEEEEDDDDEVDDLLSLRGIAHNSQPPLLTFTFRFIDVPGTPAAVPATPNAIRPPDNPNIVPTAPSGQRLHTIFTSQAAARGQTQGTIRKSMRVSMMISNICHRAYSRSGAQTRNARPETPSHEDSDSEPESPSNTAARSRADRIARAQVSHRS